MGERSRAIRAAPVLCVALVALLFSNVAVAASGSDTAATDGTFTPRTKTWYITSDVGGVPGIDVGKVPLMRDRQTSASHADLAFPVLGLLPIKLPPLPLLGSDYASTTRTWFYEHPWSETQGAVGEATVRLDFALNVRLAGRITGSLLDVAPDGKTTEIGRAARDVDADPGSLRAVTLRIPVDGRLLAAGHTVALRVDFGTGTILSALRYGAADAPSGVQALKVQVRDSDGDGLSDTVEEMIGTDPADRDTDGDGVYDGPEHYNGSDPLYAEARPSPRGPDSDNDGLPDSVESNIGTDAARADTDGDGFSDGVEHRSGSDPGDAHDAPIDRDGDGLPDAFEAQIGTDPNRARTGGGISDARADPDADDLANIDELAHGTDPLDPDTDDDGASDGAEVARGTDPLVAQRQQAGMPVAALLTGAGLFVVGGAASGYGIFRRFAA